VLPCPSAKSLDLIRETKHRAAADSVKALVLADSLQEPLRGELRALLTDSGSVTAAKRYSDVAQVDLATARRVVSALEKQTHELIAPAPVSGSVQNTVTDPAPGKPVIDAAPDKPVADSVPNKPVADSVQNNP
jgi:hypothetical protein